MCSVLLVFNASANSLAPSSFMPFPATHHQCQQSTPNMHAYINPPMRHTAYASFNIHTIHTPTGDSIVFARLETTLQTLVLHTFRKYNILLSHSLIYCLFLPTSHHCHSPDIQNQIMHLKHQSQSVACGDARVTCQKWSPYSNNTAKPNKQSIP